MKRIASAAGLAGLAVVLGACAAAVPGYVPESSRPNRLALIKPDPGTMTPDGGFQLSESEKKLDCRRLTGSMQIIVSRLKVADSRPRPSATGQLMQKGAAIVGEDTSSLNIDAEVRRERARLEAYNRQLAAKGCKTMNIEAELAAPR